MKNIREKIEVLRLKHGTYGKVAAALGISYRQLCNVRNGESNSKTLIKLIDILSKQE